MAFGAKVAIWERDPDTCASAADEIRKLGELRADGLLSDEEFEAQKAKILG